MIRIIITCALFFLLLSCTSTDSDKKTSDSSTTSAKESSNAAITLHKQPSDYRFGIFENGYFLTLASDGKLGQLDPEDFVNMGYEFPHDQFTPIEYDSLSYYTDDHVGDTVTAILNGQPYKFTFSAIGYYHTRNWCYDKLFVKLEPVGSPPPVDNFTKFLIVPDNPDLLNSIRPYTPLRPSDPVISRAVVSCGQFLLSSWQDTTYFNPAYRQYTENPVTGNDFPPLNAMVRYNPFIPADKPNPDTILSLVQGYYDQNVNVSGTWLAMFHMVYEDGRWKKWLLIPPGFGDKRFEIRYSIDIDSDGVLEYVVLHFDAIALYRLTGSEFKQVAVEQFHGC